MFLPMSWTSPFAVAMTTLPLVRSASPGCFSASMNGTRWATAFFITRADLTTCGRNIFPAPNSSPTTFMPSISGPSMTSLGRRAVAGVPRGDLQQPLGGVGAAGQDDVLDPLAQLRRDLVVDLERAGVD